MGITTINGDCAFKSAAQQANQAETNFWAPLSVDDAKRIAAVLEKSADPKVVWFKEMLLAHR